MAETDEELVRHVAEAFGRAVTAGEIDPYLDMLDPDVDFELPSVILHERVKLHGRDEVRGYLERIAQEYGELELEVREERPLGEGRFLVLGRWHGRAGGGTTFGAPMASVLALREGKVSWLQGFMDEEQALETLKS